MLLLKVLVYACAGFGLLFLFAVFVGKCIAFGNRRTPQKLTVVWRDTDVMQQAFTGTVELVGEHHIKVTADDGWSEMVDTRDIVECF